MLQSLIFDFSNIFEPQQQSLSATPPVYYGALPGVYNWNLFEGVGAVALDMCTCCWCNCSDLLDFQGLPGLLPGLPGLPWTSTSTTPLGPPAKLCTSRSRALSVSMCTKYSVENTSN